MITVLTSTVFAQSKEEQLHKLMEAYASTNKLNGTVLIAQNNKILLSQGYGFRNVTDSLRNEVNTIFQVGSVTKQLTATVILKLQEMKKISIQDKLSKYFTDFPNGENITIENLLTHTSGIYNYTDDRVFMQTQALQPTNREKMLASFKDKPLKFVPGSDWEYSNSNYVLLGYIIEIVSRKPYEQVVRELILKPLKMNSTGFDYKTLKNDNTAQGYTVYSKEGNKESVEFDPTVSYAAGSMYTTTGDLYKWQKGMAENKIIKKSSFDKASTPNKYNYGYGIYINLFNNKKYIAHGGLTFGYTSYVGRLEEDDVSIIILNNIVNYSINDIAKDVLAILYNKPYKLPEALKETVLSTEILKKYSGTYEVSPQFTIAVTIENNQIFAQATGQNKVLLSALKEDFFFLKGTDVKIEFKKDASNNIQGLLLMEGGQGIPAKKIN